MENRDFLEKYRVKSNFFFNRILQKELNEFAYVMKRSNKFIYKHLQVKKKNKKKHIFYLISHFFIINMIFFRKSQYRR